MNEYNAHRMLASITTAAGTVVVARRPRQNTSRSERGHQQIRTIEVGVVAGCRSCRPVLSVTSLTEKQPTQFDQIRCIPATQYMGSREIVHEKPERKPDIQ